MSKVMKENKESRFSFFQSSSHAYYKNSYHIVFSTKYRKKIIGPIITKELWTIYQQMAIDKPDGIEIFGFGIEPDHVHILLIIPPGLAVSRAVQRIKGAPSRHIFKKYPELEKRIGKRALWQSGYFCRALGEISFPQIKAYLGKQMKEEYLME